jgi:hypothetical protein
MIGRVLLSHKHMVSNVQSAPQKVEVSWDLQGCVRLKKHEWGANVKLEWSLMRNTPCGA